jgi:hypothetical protein
VRGYNVVLLAVHVRDAVETGNIPSDFSSHYFSY